MIFWDSSAIVPLLLEEPGSARALQVLESDRRILVWWATPLECASALARRERDGMPAREIDDARAALRELSTAWNEVQPSEEVRGQAGRLLRRHPLRAADALQLAAAMTWADGRPEPAEHRLITFDDRLAAAARGEGFSLVL